MQAVVLTEIIETRGVTLRWSSLSLPSPLHLLKQLSCNVADAQRRFWPRDQRELVITAVLVFGQLAGDDCLRPVCDASAAPRLPCLLVVVRQELGIHQTGIERDLPGARYGAPFSFAGEEAVNLAVLPAYALVQQLDAVRVIGNNDGPGWDYITETSFRCASWVRYNAL